MLASNKLKILILVFICNIVAVYGDYARPNREEEYLHLGFEYQIPRDRRALEFLQTVVVKLKAHIEKLKKQNKGAQLNRAYLALGDAYHWIGHLFQADGNNIASIAAHRASYANYSKSGISNSSRINGLNGKKHALYHLNQLGEDAGSIGQDVLAFFSRLVKLPGADSGIQDICANAIAHFEKSKK